MKLIALDSSGLVASVAILENDAVLAEYSVAYKKTHSQTLLPMLDEISKMVELDVSTVDAIAIAAGPGSFTGLRIGSATAKGLGLALDKPIVEVPTLMGLAYNLYGARGVIAPIMDARRQQVYNGLYRFEGGKLICLTEQRPIAVEDLAEELNTLDPELTKEGVIFLGDGVPVYRKLLDERLNCAHSYAPAHVSRQRAASVGALAEIFYEEGRAIPADQHVPMYLRKTQAEREREERMKA
ncbi:MAG: tRNA (adenosine(37)-N6)-threonylcarbamoyltransferase complex dimerization subunit type 1 TsaB [Lachnospiraceae bacterium]|nr:tRNA (adenosine(37)-N6)-threonylcarbamoyltransferase complex dimerization subunit type 1 TsaB [Lachnospiraceae bacterium]